MGFVIIWEISKSETLRMMEQVQDAVLSQSFRKQRGHVLMQWDVCVCEEDQRCCPSPPLLHQVTTAVFPTQWTTVVSPVQATFGIQNQYWLRMGSRSHVTRRNTTPVESREGFKSMKMTRTVQKQNLCLTEHSLLPAVLYLFIRFSFRFSLFHSFCVFLQYTDSPDPCSSYCVYELIQLMSFCLSSFYFSCLSSLAGRERVERSWL